MAREYLYRLGYSNGVKSAMSPATIPQDALWDARNMDISRSGILTLRPGTRTVGPTLGLSRIKAVTTALGYPLVAWDTGLYKFVNNSWQTIRLQLFQDSPDVTFIPWTFEGRPTVFILNGHTMLMTDGTTCTEVEPYTPKAGEPENMLSQIKSTLLGTVKVSLSQRMALAVGNYIYLSSPLDPTYFPADQLISLPHDGGTIVALKSRYNSLLIYRDTDRWAFFGSDIYDPSASLVLQDGAVGCINRHSIQDVPNLGQIFAGHDNIYVVQGVSGIENQSISVPIGNDILNYYTANLVQSTNMVSTYHNNQYYLMFPDSVEPERVLRLRPLQNMAWFIDTGPRFEQMFELNGILYGSRNGQLFNYDVDLGTDNGMNIPYAVSFKHEVIKPGPVKFKRLFIYLNTTKTLQSVNASVTVDGINTTTVEASLKGRAGSDFTIGESAVGFARIGRLEEIMVYEAKLRSMKGHAVQVSINGSGYDELIKIIGYGVEYRPKHRERGIRKGVMVYR